MCRVICRFRPPKGTEIALHGQSDKNDIYVIDDTRGTITTDIDFEKKSFKFDKVFDIDATQAEVFRCYTFLFPLLDDNICRYSPRYWA